MFSVKIVLLLQIENQENRKIHVIESIKLVTSSDILSLTGVKVGNLGFYIFHFICVSKTDFDKQKLNWR